VTNLARCHYPMMLYDVTILGLLFVGGLWAGAQNALAGGGSFVTLPILMLTGLDARLANLTSTVALFPGQIVAGIQGRAMARGSIPGGGASSMGALAAINLSGGAIGAGLLLATSSRTFADLVPWLVLFATCLYIASSFAPREQATPRTPRPILFGAAQFLIAIYGGYFGGGNGFLMLAALSLAGVASRSAVALKNILLALINAAAMLVFVLSASAVLDKAAVVGAGALLGGIAGVWVLRRIDERILRAVVAAIGLTLTAWLFAVG